MPGAGSSWTSFWKIICPKFSKKILYNIAY